MYNYSKEEKTFKELAIDIINRDTLNYKQKMMLFQALVNSQLMLIGENEQHGNNPKSFPKG